MNKYYIKFKVYKEEFEIREIIVEARDEMEATQKIWDFDFDENDTELLEQSGYDPEPKSDVLTIREL